MIGMIEVTHRRSGVRGRTDVERTEKFAAEFSLQDGVLCLSWRASNGQQNDLACPMTRDLREALIEKFVRQSGEGEQTA
jgi:hypothetical protein